MFLQDLLADGQAQTGAPMSFAGDEHLKDLLELFRFQPWAIIADRDGQQALPPRVICGLHHDPCRRRIPRTRRSHW